MGHGAESKTHIPLLQTRCSASSGGRPAHGTCPRQLGELGRAGGGGEMVRPHIQ